MTTQNSRTVENGAGNDPRKARHLAENRRVAAFAAELRTAYAAAGQPLSDETIVQVAASLSDALREIADAEVPAVFAEARDIADLPTQRTLRLALARIRERAHNERNRVPDDWPDGMTLREYMLLTGDRRLSELAHRPRAGFAL